MNLSAVENLPHVHDWLDHSRAAVEIVEACSHEADTDRLLKVTEQNVLLQLQHLRTHPAVAARIGVGSVGLHGWVYHIESGEVTCFDEERGEFVPLQERYATLLASREEQSLRDGTRG